MSTFIQSCWLSLEWSNFCIKCKTLLFAKVISFMLLNNCCQSTQIYAPMLPVQFEWVIQGELSYYDLWNDNCECQKLWWKICQCVFNRTTRCIVYQSEVNERYFARYLSFFKWQNIKMVGIVQNFTLKIVTYKVYIKNI